MNNKVVNDVRAQGAKNQPKYKGVQKITETQSCARMIMRTKVSMYVETIVALHRTDS